jgi:hypothetical protein
MHLIPNRVEWLSFAASAVNGRSPGALALKGLEAPRRCTPALQGREPNDHHLPAIGIITFQHTDEMVKAPPLPKVLRWHIASGATIPRALRYEWAKDLSVQRNIEM